MKHRALYIFLLAFLLADLGYSFLQHYHQPMDGDMPRLVVPADYMSPVFESPFGLKAIREGITYSGPNRFFSHWSLYAWFSEVPAQLQSLTDPVDSVYLASAIFKTAVQLLIILMLAIAITGSTRIFHLEFLLGAALVTPFMQTNGYRGVIGIIDSAPTYVFFYAFPLSLLLLYFLPFFLREYHNRKWRIPNYSWIAWIPLAMVCSLSGPTNPAVALVLSFVLFIRILLINFRNTDQVSIGSKIRNALQNIPGSYFLYLVPICVFSLYSLYLGTYNSENEATPLALSARYAILPKGIYFQFFQKLAFPVLFVILGINVLLIRYRLQSETGRKILRTFLWMAVFSTIYILLLPLGGYREYRAYILRYDTIMPVTICLIFLFGVSTMYIFRRSTMRQRSWYVPLILVVGFIYMNADRAEFHKSDCQRAAMEKISSSTDPVVRIADDCTLLSWDPLRNPEESRINAQLLMKWGVTDTVRLYYQ